VSLINIEKPRTGAISRSVKYIFSIKVKPDLSWLFYNNYLLLVDPLQRTGIVLV
jgi:hypothetical protein